MVVTTTMFASAGVGGWVSAESFRLSARTALMLVMVGISLLWPMTRLCQARPDKPVSSTIKDGLILALPAQAIVWPQLWLSRWPLEVVAALSASLLVWTGAIGAILSITWGLLRGPGPGRILAFATCVTLVLVGAAVALTDGTLGSGREPPRSQLAWMYSPITSIYEISRDRPWSGRSADVLPSHGRALAVVGAWTLVGWGVGGVLCGLRAKR